MAYSADVYDLMSVNLNNREIDWERSFLRALPTARFNILNEAPVAGPDGWPYLLVNAEASGKEPAAKIISWLSERGIGLVINPQKTAPDYVLTYGMIWNYRERGEFLSARDQLVSEELTLKQGDSVHSGPPSLEYLPQYTRNVLRAFFKDNGTPLMKVLVVGDREKNDYSLCFSLEALGEPSATEHKGILEALSWFLPSHYSLAIMSERGLPKFFEL